MKQVTIVGHTFDCLAGHVFLTETGNGGSLRVACCAAVRKIMGRRELRGKRVGSFKLSVVVNKNQENQENQKKESV